MHAKRERERLRFTSVIELMVVCGQGHLNKERERDKEKERNQRKERSELIN